jgi:hypothetical protein
MKRSVHTLIRIMSKERMRVEKNNIEKKEFFEFLYDKLTIARLSQPLRNVRKQPSFSRHIRICCEYLAKHCISIKHRDLNRYGVSSIFGVRFRWFRLCFLSRVLAEETTTRKWWRSSVKLLKKAAQTIWRKWEKPFFTRTEKKNDFDREFNSLIDFKVFKVLDNR